jgi:hypothetical protein
MVVIGKGKSRCGGIAKTDEYEDPDQWKVQEEYWRGYPRPNHRLKGRQTLVDIIPIQRTPDGIKPGGRKLYTYPREQLSPLNPEESKCFLNNLPKKRLTNQPLSVNT